MTNCIRCDKPITDTAKADYCLACLKDELLTAAKRLSDAYRDCQVVHAEYLRRTEKK